MNARVISLTCAALLLTGCTSAPLPSDEILRQLAANAAGQTGSEAVAETPADAKAIQRAAAEVRAHIAHVRQEAPAASAAPHADYEVSVTALRSMAGTWRMVSPTKFTVSANEKDRYGRVHDFLCRVDQSKETLRGSCLPTRADLSGSMQGDAVSLGWASTVVRARIAGRMMTPTDFAGTISLALLGVNLTGADIPVYAVKVPASIPAPPQIDAVAARLFADFAATRLPGDPPLSAAELKALGRVQERLYLGSVEGQDEKPQAMHVYDVEFEKGWKLCGFTLNDEGGADHLECR